MGYNKVIVNGVTKVDLTSDTVSPDTMLESTTAHNAAGDLVTGTIPVNPQLSVADGGAVIVPQGYYSGSELIGYLLPIPTAEDAKKVVRVNDSGTGYELVDPSELNGPVGVTETVTGNPAVLLNSIGGQKLRGLKIYGKSTQAKTNGYQLFDANTVQYGYRWGSGGLENVEGSTEQYWASAPIPVVAGSTYTVTRQNSYRNFYLDESESVLEEIEGAHGNSASPHTFTVPEAAKFAVFTSKLNPEDEGAVSIDPKNVMLNLGPAAIPYEPYTGGKPSPSPEYPQEIVSAGDGGSIAMTVSDGADQSQSLTISPPNGLPGILVGSDGNYVDADGQERICDVADAENGKYIEYIHKINLYDNELNWSGPTETEINKNIVYQISNYVDDFPDASIDKFELNCNILSYRNLNYDEALNGIPKIYAYGNVIAVQFPPNTAYSTLPAFKSMLQETQAVLYYQLKIPIETTFATEEITAYHGLTTYDGMTVVSTAEPVAGLEVKYLTELQSYTESVVDKKVSEAVTSAVILAQGGAV